ncbi:MAG: hypothetical protein H0X33_12020 [Taibaiella sp.]|nr:hypothetical protein [Taibaiella sp.]
MVRTFALAILLFFGLCSMSFQSASHYSGIDPSIDTIQWREGYVFHASDFKGVPDRASPHVAISTTGINYYLLYNAGKFAGFKAEAVFYRHESWLKKELIENLSYTLKHELGHFIITEIYALKLESELYKFRQDTTNRDVDIQNVYDAIIASHHAMQQQYDSETGNSTNSGKQREWNKTIRLVLSTQMAFAQRQ